ncbi:MAG: 4-(cytidine 5'-diphospho)-2-C-methyl-D-erythritol kinase [Acholeplasma sp.]|nr:4-(cytidine 5'-diphospho)-2-C-methyl-D-erythritol kinase [Acholeplasma sp.]
MTEKAYAKLNIILEVKGKRTDGYHELKSLMIPLDYYDTLEFSISDKTEVISNIAIENNSILKTIHLMKKRFNIQENVSVKLNKVIPIGSGLGGASADISATIRGVNQLFRLNLDIETQESLANELGSDTLFTLHNQRAIIEGRGDRIKLLETPSKLRSILLILPGIELLTKDVFHHYKSNTNHDFEQAYDSFLNGRFDSIFNDLLTPALNANSGFKALYEKLIEKGLKVYMSGSGSTLYLINPTEKTIKLLNSFENLTCILTQEH